jgi:hypothetical protein
MVRLVQALASEDMTIIEIHYEYGIYDSAPELDEGWLYPVGGEKEDFLKSIPLQ